MNELFYSYLTIDNPIVKNHLVHGHSILPGLAYIDMLFQLIKDGLNLDYRNFSIKRLSIFNPLIVSKKRPVRLKITLNKKQEYFELKAENAEASMGQLYITAELHKERMKFKEKIDIESIKLGAAKKTSIKTVYAEARKAGLVHQDFFKAKGTIYFTEPGCFIDVYLDAAYQNEEPELLYHPTLIDGAALASMVLINRTRTEFNIDDLFLPLSCEVFYGSEPLRNRCFVRVDQSSIRCINEIFTYNMEFYNSDGYQIAGIIGLTSKRIRHQDQINPGNKKGPDKSVNEGIMKNSHIPVSDSKERIKNKRISNLEDSLKKILAKYIRRKADQIEINMGFFESGLESSQLLSVVKDIEDALNLSLSPSLLFEYSNLNDLLVYLESELTKADLSPESKKEKQMEFIPDKKLIQLESHTYEFYENEPFLQDHQVFEKPALMGITHPCLVLESYIRNNPEYPVELRNIRFTGGPVGLKKNDSIHVQVDFNEGEDRVGFKTTYYMNADAEKKLCCTGDFIGVKNEFPVKLDIASLINQSKQLNEETIKKCYMSIKDFILGPELQTIIFAYEYDKSTHICKVDLSGKLKKGTVSNFILDPLLLNACYLLSNPDAIGSNNGEKPDETIFIPLAIANITVYRPMTEKVYIVKNVSVKKEDFFAFDAMILTETGEIIAEITNASLKKARSLSQLGNLLQVIADNPENIKKEMKIAIIGLSGQYPCAKNIEEFWENLKNGKDCITEIPEDRWDWREYFDKDKNKPGKMYCKWGGFLDGVDLFDPSFFNISPREAVYMDPQERMFLECAYKTLEDAGYTRNINDGQFSNRLGGNVGVYAGVMYEEYPLYGAQEQVLGRMLTLGGTPSSIANRVSYIFNFHGPSMAVDTMCSSSLTAIHLACQSLERGECDAAIAGGVNVSIHPNKYLLLSQGKFVSTKGRCESFGKGGDGYVPGEGVGAVLLKPLYKAIIDGDHIYGVIIGSMLNAGGKTSGYSVPNPAAQGDLIKKTIEKAGIDARLISYIEAHGTGTSLGDPIEITGLTKAFRYFTRDNKFCAIGSVKSNIGHCESAAGIAGVTKVLLQIKHRELVPSLHSKELNPNIDFSRTPFIVQRELEEWKSDGPRIAGISSLGAGGSNAHMIIKEYIPENDVTVGAGVSNDKPVVIILSARDKERLFERVHHLLKAVKKEGYGNDKLPAIAYTLQTGREGMNERLGFTVTTIKEMKKKLQSYARGDKEIPGIYYGQVKQGKDIISRLITDEDLQEKMDAWISEGNFGKIVDAWVKGYVFDWNKLYEGKKPGRISLPTYSFEKKKYWIKQEGIQRITGKGAMKWLHPLVQENTSSLMEQRFSSVFTGDEFFIADSIINGQKILPGSAYLEMVRAAVTAATEIAEGMNLEIQLKNMVWNRPFIVADQSAEVFIGLYAGDNGAIDYRIYSKPGNSDAEPVIHARGKAFLNSGTEKSMVDINNILSECNKTNYLGSQCYETFKAMGIEYSPEYQGIEELYVGRDQVLAKLNLPYSVSDTLEQFILHPSILDSALQAAIGFILGKNKIPGIDMKPSLPVALDELRVMNECTNDMWAYIRFSPDNLSEEKIRKFDIDVCDEAGKICVSLKGITYQERSQTSIHQKSLQPLTATELTFSKTHSKPEMISLSPLSVDHNLSKLETNQIKIPDISSSKNISLPDLEVKDEKPVIHVRNSFSLRSIQEELRKSLASVLAMNQLDIKLDDTFTNLGLDSITGVEWIQTINKKYKTSIKATIVYDFSSIAELAGFLKNELDQQGEGIIQTSSEPDSLPSLKDIIQQVAMGNLDAEQADRLFHQVIKVTKNKL